MNKYVKYGLYALGVLVVLGVVGFIFYQFGQNAGFAAGAAGTIALAAKYRKRDQETNRVEGVIKDARKNAKIIRESADEITDSNIAEAKAKTADELAADVDSIT